MLDFDSPDNGQRAPSEVGNTGPQEAGQGFGQGVVTQSEGRTIGRLRRCVAVATLAGMLAGCSSMSSLTSGIGGGWFGGQSKPKTEVGSVTEDQLLAAAKTDTGTTSSPGGEVAHGCPRFQIWAREGYVTIYEPGKVGDGLAVMHRGEITKTARECHVEPGRITVKYGFSGRVLLGPKGKSGQLSLPVNVFVTDARREKIVTDKVKIDVDVALDRPIGYFSLVRTVSFPMPEGSRPGEFEVYVGFDRAAPGAG
jgi:hypothetical protein